MNKRRLKEIKDSINLQYELWKECENTILIDEEKELYNEVIRLHKIIKEAREYIEDRQEDINNGGNEHEYRVNKHILEILDKENK